MADVLIRGMEMPSGCNSCPLCMIVDADCTDGTLYYGCRLLKKAVDIRPDRLPDCPLIELPPHGDLIERDYITRIIGGFSLHWEYGDGVSDCWNAIMTAPTVIPADKESET